VPAVWQGCGGLHFSPNLTLETGLCCKNETIL